jgi:hypothetical protein
MSALCKAFEPHLVIPHEAVQVQLSLEGAKLRLSKVDRENVIDKFLSILDKETSSMWLPGAHVAVAFDLGV